PANGVKLGRLALRPAGMRFLMMRLRDAATWFDRRLAACGTAPRRRWLGPPHGWARTPHRFTELSDQAADALGADHVPVFDAFWRGLAGDPATASRRRH